MRVGDTPCHPLSWDLDMRMGDRSWDLFMRVGDMGGI